MTIAKRIGMHCGFWMLCILVLTSSYRPGLPSYAIAFKTILMVMPVHICYFYAVAYWAIPRYLYSRRYLKLISAFLLCFLLAALMFRLLEILVIVPYIYNIFLAADPGFQWAKAGGDFWQQLVKPEYIINAFEQSNLVVWILISFRFFKLWHERRQVALQAELNFLKGQIHPHFLFNTLNNLYALTLSGSKDAPPIVMGLSNILRYMLYECKSETVSLSRDIEILQSYIGLEKIRYEGRLDLNINIEGAISGKRIAPLLMLPLVENAFKHGASEVLDDAWINIDLKVADNTLKFKISNSKPDKEQSLANGVHFGNIGLSNVRKRLDLLYPAAHTLQIIEEEELFVAILDIDLLKLNQLAKVDTDYKRRMLPQE
jgi:hypothetical protein